MAKAVIGIGSNLGDRLANLKKSVDIIRAKHTLLKFSSVYETAPYGYTEQDNFYNCVIEVDTSFSPDELLKFLLNTENVMGRRRVKKWGPRIIDLDIIFYENLLLNDPKLTVPHPDYRNRIFVLLPLVEILGEFIPPDSTFSVKELLDNSHFAEQAEIVSEKWITLS